jgi:hypothetical protein
MLLTAVKSFVIIFTEQIARFTRGCFSFFSFFSVFFFYFVLTKVLIPSTNYLKVAPFLTALSTLLN